LCTTAKILKQATKQLHVYDTPPTNVKAFLKLRQVKDRDKKEDNNTDNSDVEDNEDFEDNNPLMFIVENLFWGKHMDRENGEIPSVSKEFQML
jgi:hypothetical protein